MAHQDDAGLQSVKHSVTPAGGLLRHALRGVQWGAHRPGGNFRTARPTAGITPVVVDLETSLLLEVTHGSRALEATPKQPRRVRECTSRGVRKETAVLRDGAVKIRFENGLLFLSGRCRPDSTL